MPACAIFSAQAASEARRGNGSTSLDERSVDLVLDLFARLRAERPGMTMIIVTHDVRVAGTADRIIWLRDGQVDYAHRAAGSA